MDSLEPVLYMSDGFVYKPIIERAIQLSRVRIDQMI